MSGGDARPTIPDGLRWWRDVPGGAAWLERLPAIVEACALRWALELEPAFAGGAGALVLPATSRDGTRCVLKVNFPEPETEHEGAALAHWAGRGAVGLLAEDPAQRALLLERVAPGSPLWTVPDEEEANRIAAGALRRLWCPPPDRHPFALLADEAARWSEEIPERWERLGRPFERGLVDAAVGWLRELGPRQHDPVVVHQDFHGGNVLDAGDGAWRVIDPKPLLGERAFDTASLLRDRRQELDADPDPGRRVTRRLDQLAGELDLDRERMRGWGIAHALAWGMEETVFFPLHIACARWLAEAP